MVKITKYDKEKRRAVREKDRLEESKIKYKTFENMRYILVELWKSERIMFVLLFVEIAAQIAFSLLGTFTDKYVVELALGTSDRVRLAVICLLLIAGGRLAKYIMNECADYHGYVGDYGFLCHMKRKIIRKCMSTDYENNESCDKSNALKKAETGSDYISYQTINALKYFLIAVIQLLAYSSILSMLNPVMIAIVAVPSIIGFFIERHKMQWVWNMTDNWQKYDRELDYIHNVGRDFSRAKDVRIYGMERWLDKLFSRSFKNRLCWYAQEDEWCWRHEALRSAFIYLADFAAYACVIYMVIRGSIGVGDFVLYFNSIYALSFAVRDVFDKLSGFNWLSNNISYSREYLDIKDKTNRAEGETLPSGECEIEFRNVSYKYSGSESDTIRNISFTLHKGERLALVGLNGAGKTTLIKLMCGFYDPTEGEILLNGKPVNSYNREEYFSLFSAVFQDISVLPVTAAENISGTENSDMERVFDCMKKAGIYDKIMSLPQKENTRLVKTIFEDAAELSGGQTQKLALARALYKDAPVLLLDEPTAALDPIAEQEMYLNYAEFSKAKSSVFISHRLASTRFCDRIILIENGTVCEEGTHEQLMTQNGKNMRSFSISKAPTTMTRRCSLMNDNEKKLTPKERRQIIKRTLKAVNTADKGYVVRDTVCYVLDLAGDFVKIFLTALVIDGISQGKSLGELLLSAGIVVGVEAALSQIKRFIKRRQNSHEFIKSSMLFQRLNRKVMTMDYVHLESTDTQNQFQNAMRQPNNKTAGMMACCNYFCWLVGGIFMILTGIILIAPTVFREPNAADGFGWFIQSPWGFLAVAAIVAALEILKTLVINPKAIVSFEKIHNDKNVLQAGRADGFFTQYVLNNYRSGKEIRTYRQQALIEKELDAAQRTIRKGWLKGYKDAMLPNFLFQLVNISTKALMYGFAVLRAMSGMLSVGEVLAFALYFEKISAGVSEMSDGLELLKITPTFCKQYFDFLDIPDEKYMGTIPTEKRDDNEYEFEFKHVWFKYPQSEEYALCDVNLKWRIGEKMALVGKNGCGKSTLVKLLTRLYDPTEGEITLNGIDIRKYKYEEYMGLFSVVFQDSGLFSFSLAENVAADTDYDPERVRDCVIRAGLSERLNSMENGVETCLYKDFDEKGVEISGGEMQKLCLARAIYKGAPFIVLDEPTAALDPISEHDIYTKFNGIVGTRTAIYISHRLSSCRFCDEITVMDNGRIVQRGSHNELLEKGGTYAALWSAQAEYYKNTAGELFA